MPGPGRYRVAVGRSGARSALGFVELALRSDAELVITYESRDTLRIGGGIAAGVLIAAGLAAVFGGAFVGDTGEGGPALLIGGAIGTTIGLGLAIAFGALGDSLRVLALRWPGMPD